MLNRWEKNIKGGNGEIHKPGDPRFDTRRDPCKKFFPGNVDVEKSLKIGIQLKNNQ